MVGIIFISLYKCDIVCLLLWAFSSLALHYVPHVVVVVVVVVIAVDVAVAVGQRLATKSNL